MKKILLSIAAMALCSSAAMAESVTFDFTANNYGLPANQADYVTIPTTITEGEVSMLLEGNTNAWRYWTDGLREYRNNAPKFTLSASGKLITEVTWTAKDGCKLSLTSKGEEVNEWTGSVESITFYADLSTGNAAIQTLTVTFGEGGTVTPPPVDPDPDDPDPTPGEGTTVTYDSTTQGYENAQDITNVTVDDVTIVFAKGTGSNAPKYYDNGTAVRCYGGNTITISATEGNLVTGVAFLFGTGDGSNEITADPGVFSSPVWTGSAQSVVFTISGTSGNRRIQAIDVTYAPGEGGDTPTPPAPAEKINVAKALELIEANEYGTTVYQVTGVISEITEISEQFGNATYLIVDQLGDENALTVFRGKWIDGANFTENLIEVGGTVVVEGTLTLYEKDGVSTPEMNQGNVVISYTAPNGGEEPDPDQPGEEDGDVTENFTTGIGFPDGSANVPTDVQQYTSTETEILYDIYGCYANSGYIMMNAKNYEQPFIAWTLDFDMVELIMTTTSGCSENEKSQVEVYGDSELIGTYPVNVRNAEVKVEIPEVLQTAGTVYKVQTVAEAGVNQQFASFTYVKAESEDSNAVAGFETEDNANVVYYNLQGVRVNNPEKGIFIRVSGNKVTKVVK